MDGRPAEGIPWRRGRGATPHTTMLVFWLLGGILLAFVLLPLVALSATQTIKSLARIAEDVEVADALTLSLAASFVTAVIAGLFGVPLAYLLARGKFPGKGVIAAIIDLPLAVPHTVAGIALLMVFGRRGVIGGPADALFGLQFWGSFAGIVVAMLFVSAPFTVNAARIGFEAVDPRLEMVARTLGMGPWKALLTVTLPLAWRGIATGLTLTFARSISEFGAVVLLVYYPMTVPVKIYEMFLRFGLDDAASAATLLLLVSLALFILFRALALRRDVTAGAGR
jgi:molybdate/tungstate transport system permease protein